MSKKKPDRQVEPPKPEEEPEAHRGRGLMGGGWSDDDYYADDDVDEEAEKEKEEEKIRGFDPDKACSVNFPTGQTDLAWKHLLFVTSEILGITRDQARKLWDAYQSYQRVVKYEEGFWSNYDG